jgi:uncharacterized coiled-coil protein SlyX|nr:MAG TPA: hypothetical protein [Caudoviricetes sp.]
MNFQVYSFVNISNIIENAVSSFRTEYYLSSSNTELIGGSWSTNIPPWSNGKYYWQRTVTTFTDPTKQPEISKPVCITGAAGHDGKGVVSIVPEYAISQSSTEPPVSGWADKPKKWMFGYYLWTRFKITYTDKTTSFTTPTCDSSWEIVNDIEIGGKNLLTCTSSIMGYNDDQRNWAWKSWKTVMTNTVDKSTDSIHIVTQGGDVDINSGIAFNTKKINYKIGETYTFSIAIRGTYNLTDKFIAHIYYTNKENKEVYDKTEITWIDNQDGINDGLSSIRFQRRFITFTVPDDYNETTNNLLIIISCKKMDILLCRPQLERGNKPTDWKVAEEDLQSQIDSTIKTMSGISSLVDKINGNITNKIWVSDINTAVDSFNNTTIQSIRDQVSSQEQTLSGFNQTVKDMQTTIEKKADGSTVETLSNKISQTEQSLNGFKTTVENTYATNANLTSNYYNKSQTEQLANKIYWLVTDSSSSSSLTLTSKALEAVTNQFIVKSPDGKRIVLEKGKITADALQSNNYVAPGHNSVYAQAGTFYNLSDGSITSKNFVVDQYGNVNLKGTVYATGGSFTGDIVANSLTLGSNVTIPEGNVVGSSSYIKKDVTLGYVSQGSNGFQVSSNGLLKASNAIIYGTVYASSGSFSGTVYASSGSFTGTVNANAGIIGGCTISGNRLQVPSANITGQLTSSQIASNSITSDKIYSGAITTAKLSTDAIKSQNYSAPGYYDDGYAQQGSYLNLSNGSFTSKNLVIDNYGNLKLKGNVTATSGIIGGCNISNGSLQVPAANITGTLSANQIIVGYNTLQSKLDSMATDILNAAKTATNYITMDYNGVMVSDTSQGSYGSNVLIASDGVNIRNGTTTVASFKANEIELGKGNKNSVIKLCDGFGKISVVHEDYGGGSYSEFFKIYSPTTEICGDDWVRLETGQGLSNITVQNEEIISTCYGTNNESIFSVYAGEFDAFINLHVFNSKEINDFEITSYNTTTSHTIISEQYMQASKGFTCGSATDNFQNNVLWSGTALWPSDSHTCNFSKPVSQQPHGILLVFRGYDGNALNADWHTFFVSKKEISSHQGQGHSFFLSHTPCTNFSTKYIYIYDTYLRGHANNNQSGTGSNGVKYTNNKYALQYVVGV